MSASSKFEGQDCDKKFVMFCNELTTKQHKLQYKNLYIEHV